jgi:hypothetical protein
MAFRFCLLPTEAGAMPQAARTEGGTDFPSGTFPDQTGPEAHGTVELE